MRDIMGNIENSKIDELDLNAVQTIETAHNNEFFELVFSLQKLARELTSIASTDNQKKEKFPENVINDQFIAKLNRLNEVKYLLS